MAVKKEVKAAASLSESGLGVYVDSSALAKLYVPEPESDRIDRFLHGRRDLMISELSVTEVLSAVARRRREGALDVKQAAEIRDALLTDAASGSFHRLDLTPNIHREAERILLATGQCPCALSMLYTSHSRFPVVRAASSHSMSAWPKRPV